MKTKLQLTLNKSNMHANFLLKKIIKLGKMKFFEALLILIEDFYRVPFCK